VDGDGLPQPGIIRSSHCCDGGVVQIADVPSNRVQVSRRAVQRVSDLNKRRRRSVPADLCADISNCTAPTIPRCAGLDRIRACPSHGITLQDKESNPIRQRTGASDSPPENVQRLGPSAASGFRAARNTVPACHCHDDDGTGAVRAVRRVMLPQNLELPGSILLIFGGVIACVAGYRLFRTVLAVYGFVLGAMLASSVMGITNTLGMVVAALIGGLVGSLILVFAWFVGVALVGAGLGALVAHLVWTQIGTSDPPPVAVIVVSVVGAIIAMVLQRYVIIIGTAFGGAWTIIVGVINALAVRGGARPPATDAVWILYPLAPAPGQRWVPVLWIVLGLFGTVVQLGLTSRRR
jgi:hypothetical protein